MRKVLFGFLALALVAAPALAKPGKYNKKVSVGEKAPTFSGIPAYDCAAKQDASLTLGDIKEDVVVLCFAANHCPAVVATEDRMVDFVNSYKGKPVKFVAVAVSPANLREQDSLPAIKDRAKDKGFNFCYGFDESQEIGKNYGATNTPQFFVLDKDRTIRYMGAMDDSTMKEDGVKKTYLKDAVDALLAGKDIEVTETRPVGCGIHYDK